MRQNARAATTVPCAMQDLWQTQCAFYAALPPAHKANTEGNVPSLEMVLAVYACKTGRPLSRLANLCLNLGTMGTVPLDACLDIGMTDL